jgi:hypothetical protein
VRKSEKRQGFVFRFAWLYIPLTIVVALMVGVSGCSQNQISSTPTPTEPAIPANYVTYTDELGLFSVSYPPDWDIDLSLLADMAQAAKDYVESIDSNLPIEKVSYLFSLVKSSGKDICLA